MLFTQSMNTTIRKKNYGFSYLAILMGIGIASIGMQALMQVWSTVQQREHEKELIFIGQQYRNALLHYYQETPSGAKHYPYQLEDLLIDKRYVTIKRHLRKLYRDPFHPEKPWHLIKENDQIIGVYSESTLKPIKQSGFTQEFESFAHAEHYSDWKFVGK